MQNSLTELNIISDCLSKGRQGGPLKVIKNILIGLDRIGQKYSINEPLKKHQYNWIHDSIKYFIEAAVNNTPAIVGPNLFVLPEEIPVNSKYDHLLFLHPSEWAKNVWLERGFKNCNIAVWPVGIDTDSFIMPVRKASKNVILYFKNRPQKLKFEAISLLEKLNYKINLIEYGTYNENEFKQALKNSYFGIWIGTTESQGIALLEALASGLPLIVLESNNILDNTSIKKGTYPLDLSKHIATSVPYFDNRCGFVIKSLDELEMKIVELNTNYNMFDPAAFVQENLNLEITAKNLVSLFAKLANQDNGLSKRDYSVFNKIKSRYTYYNFVLNRKMRTALRLVQVNQ